MAVHTVLVPFMPQGVYYERVAQLLQMKAARLTSAKCTAQGANSLIIIELIVAHTPPTHHCRGRGGGIFSPSTSTSTSCLKYFCSRQARTHSARARCPVIRNAAGRSSFMVLRNWSHSGSGMSPIPWEEKHRQTWPP